MAEFKSTDWIAQMARGYGESDVLVPFEGMQPQAEASEIPTTEELNLGFRAAVNLSMPRGGGDGVAPGAVVFRVKQGNIGGEQHRRVLDVRDGTDGRDLTEDPTEPVVYVAGGKAESMLAKARACVPRPTVCDSCGNADLLQTALGTKCNRCGCIWEKL